MLNKKTKVAIPLGIIASLLVGLLGWAYKSTNNRIDATNDRIDTNANKIQNTEIENAEQKAYIRDIKDTVHRIEDRLDAREK